MFDTLPITESCIHRCGESNNYTFYSIYRGCHNGVSTVNKETRIYISYNFRETQRTILMGKIISKVYTCFTLMGSSKSLLVMEE